MRLFDLLKTLEQVLPASTAMAGDRLGLQVQSGREDVSSVLTCLEITEDVIREAVQNKCDAIFTFHPLIFTALTNLTNDARVGHCVQQAVKNDIAIVSVHTNYDSHPRGTNFLLAKSLELTVESALIPDAQSDGYGMGVVCITAPLSLDTLLKRVRLICGSPIRYSHGSTDVIDRIVIVAGSGSSFLGDALSSRAQVFITADLKYHTFHEAYGRMALIDPGHFEMEQFVPKGLAELLTSVTRDAENAPTFTVSTVRTNPVKYLN